MITIIKMIMILFVTIANNRGNRFDTHFKYITKPKKIIMLIIKLMKISETKLPTITTTKMKMMIIIKMTITLETILTKVLVIMMISTKILLCS